jgi:hypothetical protein
MQVFGTFPFVASEAIILGSLLGAAIAFSSRATAEEPEPVAIPVPAASG